MPFENVVLFKKKKILEQKSIVKHFNFQLSCSLFWENKPTCIKYLDLSLVCGESGMIDSNKYLNISITSLYFGIWVLRKS